VGEGPRNRSKPSSAPESLSPLLFRLDDGREESPPSDFREVRKDDLFGGCFARAPPPPPCTPPPPGTLEGPPLPPLKLLLLLLLLAQALTSAVCASSALSS